MKMKQDIEGQIDTSIKNNPGSGCQGKETGCRIIQKMVAQGGTDITEEVIKKCNRNLGGLCEKDTTGDCRPGARSVAG